MRPEFAHAIDPIILTSLEAVSRIEQGLERPAAEVQDQLARKFDEAEGRLGNGQEWRLAKYALSSWIDSLLIEDIPWRGSGWWKDNCFEKKYFGDRVAHEDFFRKALDAAELGPKDALEVFYVTVVLGFRGFYGNPDKDYARRLAMSLRLPENIEAWCARTAGILQLRQGRPQIPVTVQVGGSAKPLTGKSQLFAFAMTTAVLVALAVATYLFVKGLPWGK